MSDETQDIITFQSAQAMPFHSREPVGVGEKIAVVLLAELCSRAGVGHELSACDDDTRDEIVRTLARLVRKTIAGELTT